MLVTRLYVQIQPPAPALMLVAYTPLLEPAEAHPEDVLVLVKQWMRDRDLSQAPLMAVSGYWKADAAAWFARASQGGQALVQDMDIKEERRRELKDLVIYLQAKNPVKLRAVGYITYLANLSNFPPMPAPIAWLHAGAQPRVYLPGYQDSEGAEPYEPHNMRVVFKRQRPQ